MGKDTKAFIVEHQIIAICRGIYGEELVNLADALYKGGVRLIEVTFDQSDPDCENKTKEAIRLLVREFGGKVKVGAGTVVTGKQVFTAKDAGAEFILSPNTDVDIIRTAKDLKLVTIPGAMTPTEVLKAYYAGADLIKLFPAGTLGIQYAKDLLGPINHVSFIATAGITPENLKTFLELGFAGAGVSSYLTSKELVKSGAFDTLTEHARELTEIVAKAKGGSQ